MQRRDKSTNGRWPAWSFPTGARALVLVAAGAIVVGVAAIAVAGVGSRGDGDEQRAESGSSSTYPDVATDVDEEEWLIPAWEEDVAGDYPAFRMFCQFSHLAHADPIIEPGSDEFMHLHMFFGNVEADGSSTYELLRSAGESSCDGGPLNRSAYWMPAIFDGDDDVVVPDRFELYYKGENADDPSRIQAKPNGLRMIAGYPHPDGAELVWGWRCENGAEADPGVIPDCGGSQLSGWVRFPYCWDGENLDSPDHRSHMAYGTNNTWGPCPDSHPVHVPELTEFVHIDDAASSDEWYLTSDRIDPSEPAPNGSTFHADWFGAWDNSIQDRWTDNCIRAMRSASNGNLCDGEQLRPAASYDGPTRLADWYPRPG